MSRRLLLLLLSLHRPRAQTLWATGDSVIVSLPDSKGSSQVLSVGELVARSGPAIGDKVAVDRPSCTAGLVPGSDICVIPQALVFGKVLPISSVPTVTPPPDPLTYNTIRGRVTDFAANPLSGATVVIKGKAAGEEIKISTTTDVDGYYTATVPSDGVFTSTATYVVPQTELGRKFRSSEQAKPAEYTGTTAIWSGSSADGHGYVDVAVTSPTAATYAAFSAALTWRDTPNWQAIPDVFFSLTEPVSRPAVTTEPSLNSRPSTVATGGVKIETWTSGGVIYAPTSDPPEVTYAPDATTDLWGSWFKRVTAVLIPTFTGITTIKVQADDMFTLYLNGINVLSGNDWSQQYYVDVPLTVGTPVLFLLDAINTGGPGSISVQYTTEDGSYRTFDATIAFPGTKISLLAFPLSTVPSWAALQAQAFLRFGNSQLALRAPADAAPIPAVATIADCPTLPLWYIADVDFVTGLVPINKIIYNAAVTCSETAKLFG